MMRAIKIKINGVGFLLPESHQFYEFPTFILQYKPAIEQYIIASKKWKKDIYSNHFSDLPDLSEFKRVTGIIGFPLDLHDPDLYALDKNIEIIMETDL